MLSSMSKDLMKAVISQSGTAFSVWGIDHSNETTRNTLKLALSFNCSTKTSEEVVNCLKKVDAYEITRRQHEFYEWHNDPVMPFRPVIERGIDGAFLPTHPSEILKSGKAAEIPFMTGITTEDGCSRSPGFFGNPEIIKDFNIDFNAAAPLVFLYHDTSSNPNYVTEKIKSYYFKNQTLTNSSFSKDALTKIFTDQYFLSGVNEAVQLHINFTKQPVYYYTFGYRGAISYSELYGDSSYNYGVCHTDELLYLFDPKGLFPNYEPTSTDRNITEILTTLWINFATTGNPTPVVDAIIPSKWKPARSENLEYYFIKNVTHVQMKEKLYWDRFQFWNSLPIN
ncbi:hypothetical protein ILUMI_26463 [Ignelater luminosus]|uniref:Carboxylesterase type B domain-containing protein n=1 Tax=Ignelater luminosus TaxID=2038154 RepID=A0A8K0C4B0_IGNLU|nr:hypothetical protein ILUMI_26463 [Ignelater luminosus]